MGLFGLFCCCSGRRRKYPDSVVRYPYVPHGQPALDPILPTKEHVIETTTKAKEEITPPPDYSVNSLSKVQTVVSSAPDPDDISPTSSDTKKQDEKKDITARPIKPIRKRRDKEEGYSTEDVQLGSYTKATNGQEPKSLLKTPLPASLYEKKEETTSQPFVFSAGKGSVQVEDSTAISSSSSSPTTRVKKPLPIRTKPTAPTYPYPPSLSSSPSPPSSPISPTTTTFPSRTTTAPTTFATTTPITTTFPPPLPYSPPSPPPTDPGLTCPKCSSPNKSLTTNSTNLNNGRPYRLCSNSSCRSWNGFSDTRGLTPSEPCWCDPPLPMRLVAMNAVDARGRRKAFYSCQYKRCGAWRGAEDEETGAARWFGEEEIRGMVRRGEI
ncbi:hypothetical protein COCMIDRAFT_108164 [Bipolaris oryzae ATCC 44560]|uniref:GRF-like zinc ribbon domain-containing protein n=1 Tax=Bipolaris oryzae ATCC 44560 TaxID=930090 RepID=W6YN29_COCMI|nr:uncharacterized protein COCMIDRAFT_108164 [Bipolaris oryzae ATCC 44560]EUC40687.1 hypothetical protein COCMIDRAFT_108164 [Bipolaris oryzae ATCC 44560]